MKRIIAIIIVLSGLLLGSAAFAGILSPGVANSFTKDVAPASGYSQNVSLGGIIAILVRAVLGLLAIIFLILMIMAGFNWMTAGGDEAKVKKAQDTIKTAIIGLLIVLAAYAITYFIFNYLPFSVGSSNGSGTTSGL